jgi:hypothetical protein
MTNRSRIEATALIRPITANNQPAATPCEATVVDLTDGSLGVRVGATVDVTPNRLVELGVDGQWGRGRIIWSRPGLRDAVIAAIEVTDPAIIQALRTTHHPQVASMRQSACATRPGCSTGRV